MSVNAEKTRLQDDFKKLSDDFESTRKQMENDREEHLRRLERASEALNQQRRVVESIEGWNRLPWYKKLITPVPYTVETH